MSKYKHIKTSRELRQYAQALSLGFRFGIRDFSIKMKKRDEKIFNSPKTQHNTTEEKRRGEFGYYIGNIDGLYCALKKLNIGSFCDLGCGAGHIITFFNRYLGFRVRGYEIEDRFIEDHKDLIEYNKEDYYHTPLVNKKDLNDLVAEDIRGFDAVYFWEPFCSKKKAENFAMRLIRTMSVNQYILYNGGYMMGVFRRTVKLKYIGSINEINVFKKIK
jgi:hypothetical protein